MKILKDEILKSTRWLELIKRYYVDKNGKEATWVMATRNNNCSAVMIVPTHYTTAPDKPQKRIVITKEYRVPLADYEWGFPAGLIDKGEDVVSTAARELTEETGLHLDGITKISPSVYNTAGMTDEAITIVYADCSGEISSEYQEESENIETFLMDVNQVKELLDRDVKFGAKAWLILEAWVQQNEPKTTWEQLNPDPIEEDN